MNKRQKEIARGLAFGRSVPELASRLAVQPQCVRRHISEMYWETGASTQPGLVGWCVAHGVVTVAELQEVYGRGG